MDRDLADNFVLRLSPPGTLVRSKWPENIGFSVGQFGECLEFSVKDDARSQPIGSIFFLVPMSGVQAMSPLIPS